MQQPFIYPKSYAITRKEIFRFIYYGTKEEEDN